MQALVTLLSQPITQLAALLVMIAGLQRSGIDVVSLLVALFKVPAKTDGKSIDFDNRTALQQLMTAMETLSTHFNHETTELLTEIRDSLKENFTEIHAKHDEWDRRGIPTEDCKNAKK